MGYVGFAEVVSLCEVVLLCEVVSALPRLPLRSSQYPRKACITSPNWGDTTSPTATSPRPGATLLLRSSHQRASGASGLQPSKQ